MRFARIGKGDKKMTFTSCLICQNSDPKPQTTFCYNSITINAEFALEFLCELFNLPSIHQLGLDPSEISQCELCKLCGERIEEIKLLELKIHRIKDEIRKSIICANEGSSLNNDMLPFSVAAAQKFLFQCLSNCKVKLTPLTETELHKYLRSAGAEEDPSGRNFCWDEEAEESGKEIDDVSADPDFMDAESEVFDGDDGDLEVDQKRDISDGKGGSDEPQTEPDTVTVPHATLSQKRGRGRGRPKSPPSQGKPRTRKRIFHCRHCKRAFPLQRDLAKHLVNAHDDHIFSQCKFCGLNLQTHRRLRTEHAATNEFNTTTDQITNSTISSTPDASENASSSNPSEYIYICGQDGCTLSYDSLAKLRHHHYTKCRENPIVQAGLSHQFTCSQCPKVFSRPGHLKDHVAVVHDKAFRFCCEICGKGYHQLSHLRQHSVYHSNEFDYKCEECGKEFKKRYQLMYHQRQHTGEMPFVCEVCGKGFSRNTLLCRHREAVHGDPKYPCQICGSLFRSFEYVRQHVNVTHLGKHKIKRRQKSKQTAEDAASANVPLPQSHPEIPPFTGAVEIRSN